MNSCFVSINIDEVRVYIRTDAPPGMLGGVHSYISYVHRFVGTPVHVQLVHTLVMCLIACLLNATAHVVAGAADVLQRRLVSVPGPYDQNEYRCEAMRGAVRIADFDGRVMCDGPPGARRCTAFAKQIDHVAEVFVMPALI